MQLSSINDLDNYIFCEQCDTLHEKTALKHKEKARCTSCDATLYSYDKNLSNKALSLSLASLIIFFIANLFPLIKINILGQVQHITLSETFFELFNNGYYLVGIVAMFLIFIFPIMVIFINILIFTFIKLRVYDNAVKDLLILYSYLSPWNISHIFLVSILISVVKLMGNADVFVGVSLWALIIFVIFDLYLTKEISIIDIWDLRRRTLKSSIND